MASVCFFSTGHDFSCYFTLISWDFTGVIGRTTSSPPHSTPTVPPTPRLPSSTLPKKASSGPVGSEWLLSPRDVSSNPSTSLREPTVSSSSGQQVDLANILHI